MSRVLLVDDDSEYTRTLKELIEAEGHLVWFATTVTRL
jgi:CheY-like chemotaxis protein